MNNLSEVSLVAPYKEMRDKFKEEFNEVYNKMGVVGNSIRDFVNIHDVVDALVLVMEKEDSNGQVYNVGGGQPHTVFEFAKAVAQVFGSDLTPKIPNEYRFGDTRHIFSDITKLKSLGWEPKRTIFDSIKEYKQYLEQQTDIKDILDYSEKHMKNLGVVRRANKW